MHGAQCTISVDFVCDEINRILKNIAILTLVNIAIFLFTKKLH